MQGKSINGYTLKHLLGKGGMAEVWYAENKIGKKAAVKILLPKFCDDENVVNRFVNEAKVMVELNHPNIRQVYDYDKVGGRPAIVMEYLEGNDMNARMKAGEHFSEQRLEKWWNQMVAALNYTHAKGVVHRDIKPSNIFIDMEDNVRLLDFGIAKIKEAASSTQTGSTLGTLIYMSPEQIKDPKRVDYRTDLYSLAVTFVHLLTGKAPYDTTTTSDFDIQLAIVQEPLDLSKLPSSWRNFLAPYLSKGREQRPVLKPFGAAAAMTTNFGDDDGTIIDQSASKSGASCLQSATNASNNDSSDYRSAIEANIKNCSYRDAYNICIRQIHDGNKDPWLQEKINELIPLMKKQRKKDDRKSLFWALFIAIACLLVYIITALQ